MRDIVFTNEFCQQIAATLCCYQNKGSAGYERCCDF